MITVVTIFHTIECIINSLLNNTSMHRIISQLRSWITLHSCLGLVQPYKKYVLYRRHNREMLVTF